MNLPLFLWQKMKSFLLISSGFLLCGNFTSTGQSIVRSSLSCLGSSYSGEGYLMRQTIGQPSNTAVSRNGLCVLRQGFQQPLTASATEITNNPLVFSLNPNPAHGTTLLMLKEEISDCTITVRDLFGKILTSIPCNGLRYRSLDLSGYITGIYIVTITSAGGSGSVKLIIT